MALVESGMKDLGFKRSMESLRTQIRGQDDEGFHYLNGRLEQLQATLAEAQERRKYNYTGPLLPDPPPMVDPINHVDHREHEVDPQEIYKREIAALRADVTALKQAVATPGKHKRRQAPTEAPLSRKQKLRDVAHRLTGHHGARGR